MPAEQIIHYLHNHEIDRSRWDECISKAPNGLIYAYSIYLDHMAGQWDALVLGDYEAVMPLPWRKKLGIYYIYQPFLTAQLGLFGNSVDHSLLNEFLTAIPKKFRLWEFSLNHGNQFDIAGYDIHQRKNYVLDLSFDYGHLYEQYRENIQRNIKKSLNYGCYAKNNIDIKNIIELARERNSKISDHDYSNFERLYKALEKIGSAKCYGVFSKQSELIASAAFLFSHGRAYYILVGNHPNGRTLGASHALVDEFIREHCGQELRLDFEGSDIRNLAFFYSSFGAKEENYVAIRLNRLPWYARLIKK